MTLMPRFCAIAPMSCEGSMPSMPLQSIMLSNRPLPQPTESMRLPEISPSAFSNRRNSLWNTFSFSINQASYCAA